MQHTQFPEHYDCLERGLKQVCKAFMLVSGEKNEKNDVVQGLHICPDHEPNGGVFLHYIKDGWTDEHGSDEWGYESTVYHLHPDHGRGMIIQLLLSGEMVPPRAYLDSLRTDAYYSDVEYTDNLSMRRVMKAFEDMGGEEAKARIREKQSRGEEVVSYIESTLSESDI